MPDTNEPQPFGEVTFAAIEAAAGRVYRIAKKTPVMSSRSFNHEASAAKASGGAIEAFFKCENFQTSGAFKIRGATNFLLSIPEKDRPRGVVAFSSGNHAQAVAWAAHELGLKATIVMPTDAPPFKLEATKAQGARIVSYDRHKEDRAAIGARIAEETGATLVPPFDHPWIIAGQGTAGLEFLREMPDLDTLVVQIGGGGLASGCSIAAKHLNPDIHVIGVEPETGNDYFLSLQQGRPVEIPPTDTIADGLRITVPGKHTFPILQRNLDEVILVSDDEIRRAVKFLFERLKIVVEPSGAATAAAALFGKLPPSAKRVGLMLSGGNIGVDGLCELFR